MPIDLDALPQRLKDAAKQGTLVPFIGAGVSQHAKTSSSSPFPTWSKFLEELADLAVREGDVTEEERQQILELVKRGRFLMAAEAVKSAIPTDAFDHYIQERFAPVDAEPGQIHKSLFKLNPSLILTTNYDRLIEDAFASEYHKTPETVTYKDANLVQRYLQSHRRWPDRPLIFKIHGSVSFPADTILSEIEYRHLLYRETGYRSVLSAIFLTRVVLMLGFSFADPELTVLVEALREALKHRSSPDYIVLPRGEKGSIERRRLREDFGLQVLEYDPSPGHPELVQIIEYLAAERSKGPSAESGA
jgi:hypothetical protein